MTDLRKLAEAARDHHAPDRWDNDLMPGGYVCGECGQPTESEPCAEHQAGQALLDATSPELILALLDVADAARAVYLDASGGHLSYELHVGLHAALARLDTLSGGTDA